VVRVVQRPFEEASSVRLDLVAASQHHHQSQFWHSSPRDLCIRSINFRRRSGPLLPPSLRVETGPAPARWGDQVESRSRLDQLVAGDPDQGLGGLKLPGHRNVRHQDDKPLLRMTLRTAWVPGNTGRLNHRRW